MTKIKTPLYWLNDKTRKFMSRGYVAEGQSVEERIDVICETFQNYMDDMGEHGEENLSERLKHLIEMGWISLASPVWSNYGTEKGLPISCNNSVMDDSIESILNKAAEVGTMTKYGSGTSVYIGNLRSKGSEISAGGYSYGPNHFMPIIEEVVNIVSQGNVRRGNCAVYQDIEHPDIEEFLEFREEGSPIQHLSLGVMVGDDWMNSMIDGDPDKQRIWARVIRKRVETGYPYIGFRDTVNQDCPSYYKDLIKSSNLCIAGDQRVPSQHGLLTAKELHEIGSELTLASNNGPVKSSKMNLVQKNVPILKITLENGLEHKVTHDHKLPVMEEDRRGYVKHSNKVNDVEAINLKIGDKVQVQKTKGVFGTDNFEDEAFLLGLYQADGTQHKDEIHICIWENDFDLEDEIKERFDRVYHKFNFGDPSSPLTKMHRSYPTPQFNECQTGPSLVRKKAIRSVMLKRTMNFEKGYVPDWIWSADEKTQWQYIRGLFYADGTVNVTTGEGDPTYLSITSIDEYFIKELQLLLFNMGLSFSKSVMREEGQRLLPDGKGGNALFNCKTAHRLVCGNKPDALTFEKNTQFLTRKNVALEDREYRDNSKKSYRIVSIEEMPNEDVYCPTVDSEDHYFIANGFVTHNCNEIWLYSDHETSYVCCLSSMNLLHFSDWKDTDAVKILTYFLDTVIEEYSRKTANIKFMESAHKFAKEHRAIGVGVLGYHSYLQNEMIPFESDPARDFNIDSISIIKKLTDEASAELAKWFGEPDFIKGSGFRNATRMAIAPTTSSSMILGQVSPSIEPLSDNYFIKDLAKGKFTFRNPKLKEILEAHGKNDYDTWESILIAGGSVQHLEFLTDHERSVFKTFDEISQMEIVTQAATRQQYIDQGQSLNLKIHPKTEMKEINKLLINGWRMGIKGFYYHLGTNLVQEKSRQSINECSSCSA